MDDNQKGILKQRIDEVLYYFWDPIGVKDEPAARDEYRSYADQIWRMVLDSKTEDTISSYLNEIAVKRMELDPHKENNDSTADLILAWKKYLEES